MSTAQCLPLHQFDASYITKLGDRDSEVEAHFAWYFSHFMTGSLRRRAASTERINDIRQETFARVLAAVHSDQGIRRPECFGAFVASVCRNVLYESYRNDRFEPIDDMPPQLSDPAGSPEAMYTAFEVRKQVSGVLRRMPSDEGMLLRAVYLEERDRDEVCRELGISRGYLRVLLHRAKQQFRARFKKTANARPEAQSSRAGARSVRSGKLGENAAGQTSNRRTLVRAGAPLVVIQGGRSLASGACA